MKHRTLTTTSTCLLLLLAAAPATFGAEADSLVPFAEITGDGERVPAIARDFLDEGFFTRDQTAAFDSGRNYTASFALPAGAVSQSVDLGRGLAKRHELGGTLSVYLTNLGEAASDITLSALRDGEALALNGLVRVQPGETLGIAADALFSYGAVRILAIQDFAATAVIGLPGGKTRRLELDTAAPLIPHVETFESRGFEKTTNYCVEKSNVIIEVTADSSGVGVLACAQRTEGGVIGGIQSYEYAIDYPTCGDDFHCKTSGGSVFVNPPCQMSTNTTRRCSNSSIEHNWQNLDQVVFHCGTGTAQCTQGCTGSFTITCP